MKDQRKPAKGVKTFLVQLGATEVNRWLPIRAGDEPSAALQALKRSMQATNEPAALLPCTVYVSWGTMRHPNGAPMAVKSFRLVRAESEAIR